MMFISKYSPFIAAAIAVIFLFYFHLIYLPSLKGNDPAGNAMEQGYSFIFFHLIYIPFVLMVAFSLYKYYKDSSAFTGKWLWTTIHLCPLLIPLWFGFVFAVNSVHLKNQISKNDSLSKVRRDYIHTKYEDRFLIMEDSIIIFIRLNSNMGPSIETLGKVKGPIFESRWSEDILIDTGNFDINNFRDLDGKTVLERYTLLKSNQDFDSWYKEYHKVTKKLGVE